MTKALQGLKMENSKIKEEVLLFKKRARESDNRIKEKELIIASLNEKLQTI